MALHRLTTTTRLNTSQTTQTASDQPVKTAYATTDTDREQSAGENSTPQSTHHYFQKHGISFYEDSFTP